MLPVRTKTEISIWKLIRINQSSEKLTQFQGTTLLRLGRDQELKDWKDFDVSKTGCIYYVIGNYFAASENLFEGPTDCHCCHEIISHHDSKKIFDMFTENKQFRASASGLHMWRHASTLLNFQPWAVWRMLRREVSKFWEICGHVATREVRMITTLRNILQSLVTIMMEPWWPEKLQP